MPSKTDYLYMSISFSRLYEKFTGLKFWRLFHLPNKVLLKEAHICNACLWFLNSTLTLKTSSAIHVLRTLQQQNRNLKSLLTFSCGIQAYQFWVLFQQVSWEKQSGWGSISTEGPQKQFQNSKAVTSEIW